jgi:hypothetical protein
MYAFPSIAPAGHSTDDVTVSPQAATLQLKPRIGTALLGQPPPLRSRQRRPTVRQHFGDVLTSELLVNHMAPCLWSDHDETDDDTVSLAVSDDALQDASFELDVMRLDEGSTDDGTLSTSNNNRTRLPKIVGNPILSAPDLSHSHEEGRRL